MAARLIYVVGASGSGKDSLIRYSRERLAHDPAVLFAHRYITRPADAGGENHIALTHEEFAARETARLFALKWQSHGYAYGIGIEINQWLAKGVTVVVNGSREYLIEARRRYPELLPVWIDVSPGVLRARLEGRGRESESAIDARLTRHLAMADPVGDGVLINNDGPLTDAGEALVEVIARQTKRPACA